MIYVAALVIAALYCWGVATTQPFTTAADAIVALGYLLMGLVLLGRLRRRPKGAGAGRLDGRRTGNPAPWAVAILTLAIVEVAAYFAGWGAGRHAFPTLSSRYDEASSSSVAAKAVLVFLWLAMGWGLFRPRPKPAKSEPL